MNDQQNKGAWSVTVGTKGQIVIPKEARDLFDIHPGDSLLVLADVERGIAILPKGVFEALHASTFGMPQAGAFGGPQPGMANGPRSGEDDLNALKAAIPGMIPGVEPPKKED